MEGARVPATPQMRKGMKPWVGPDPSGIADTQPRSEVCSLFSA